MSENARVIRRAKANAVEDGEEEHGTMRNFKVNSNVEIVDSKKEKKGLLVKDNNDKVEKVEEPTALMAVNDPNWKCHQWSLLNKKRSPADPGDTHNNAEIIKNTLEHFGINVEVEGANVGPRITQYTLIPPAGVKVSKIAQLDRDLALNLARTKFVSRRQFQVRAR